MVSRGKWVLGFLVSVCLAACSSVPLGSLAKLSAVDMGHTPPDQLRVAFVAPEALKVRPRDMVMKVHLKLADGSFDSTRSFTLLEDNLPEDGAAPSASLAAMAGRGKAIHVMKLDDEDAKAFRKLQSVLSASQVIGARKKGSLDISFASQACAAAPLSGPLLVSA
ncbi:MAG: hypothetical protein ABIN69_05685, partial [Aestuariivirga sp.]